MRHRTLALFTLFAVFAAGLPLLWAAQLAPHGVAVTAVTPGFLRSESMLEHFGVTEDNWRTALDPNRSDGPTAPPGFAVSESPRFVGRGIAAIFAEEARHLVDPALKLMIDAVHRYEGYVAQSTGDGIFALFGAPVAHEDHAQRALYATQDQMVLSETTVLTNLIALYKALGGGWESTNLTTQPGISYTASDE